MDEPETPAVTLVINIGADADPVVSHALARLLKAVEARDAVATTNVDTSQTFGTESLKQFLLEQGLATTPKQAANFARTAMRNLLWRFLDSGRIVAFCQTCGKANGECRCPQHGSESQAAASRWRYRYYQDRNWQVTWASLLTLTSDDLARMSPQARERLCAYRDHVRANT